MEPVVLIHGYGSEHRKGTSPGSVASIYGNLPDWLKRTYGDGAVVEVDVGRYITLDDISRGLDQVLRNDFAHLLESGFHVIVHSTGALVVRNWIHKFSPRPSPIRNLIHMAGANFGSGWAHIGKGQLAKWGQEVFRGAERGVHVLNALELGSSETLDLHLYFLEPGNDLARIYEVFEYVIVGSQASTSWLPIPIRYAKEDGSDGVVRVSAGNLNFNYAGARVPTARVARLSTSAR